MNIRQSAKSVLKFMYSVVPMKKYIFNAIKIFKLPEVYWRHLHFNEKFKISFPGGHFYMYNKTCVENEIYWQGLFGGWESGSLRVFERLASRLDGTAIDCGANTGIYALLAASSGNFHSILAFEPHPYFYPMLVRNVNANSHLTGICPILAGCSDKSGVSEILDYSGVHPTIEVKIFSLDDFCTLHHVNEINLVKVDIEGMEPGFFRGALCIIGRDLPIFIVEILDNKIGEEIEDVLLDYSYSFYSINDTLDLPVLKKEIHLSRMKTGGRNYLLVSALMPDKKHQRIMKIVNQFTS